MPAAPPRTPANPRRAWARSPTIVRLRDGQRRGSRRHSASVSSWASSTTMCANGPASRSVSSAGTTSSSARAVRMLSRRSSGSGLSGSSFASSSRSTTSSMTERLSANASCRRRRPGRRARIPEAGAHRVEEREVLDGPGRSSGRPRARRSLSVNHGAQSLRYAGTDQRSETRSAASRIGQARRTTSRRSSSEARARHTSSSPNSSSSTPCWSTRMSSSASQMTSRASLCGGSGVAAARAAQSAGPTVTSVHGVSTVSGSAGGSS